MSELDNNIPDMSDSYDNTPNMNELNDFIGDSNYKFFDSIYDFESKNDNQQLYDPPYSLKVKLQVVNNNEHEVFVETNEVSTIRELPQNISDLVNKYESIQQFINSQNENLYLRFDIQFFCGLGSLDQIYCVQVDKLKKLLVN